jgi:peptidyl-prolyl cis-trans isomerase SurA
MNHRSLSAFLVVSLLSFTGLFIPKAVGQEQGETLFTVGKKAVDKEELVYLITKGKTIGNTTATLSREEFESNFELFLNFKLKVAEAEALSLDQSEEFFLEFASFKETLIAPFLIKNSLEDGELRKVYSRMQEVVRASHILFQFPSNASQSDSLAVLTQVLKVKTDLENGADFSTLALANSDDPSAKINKGDLGYFTGLQMIPQFEEAAYSLPLGSISDPVLTDFGYHIIQVKDRKANPGEVSVSHILVRFDPENVAQEENARRKISDIYAEIQKENTVWEQIVKANSEDPATKEKGGVLPWFGVGTMIPEFELAAFSLTELGEISPPLKTPYGYHILRLEGKRELQPYEELEQSIKSKILRSSKSGMIQSQVVAMQKARYGFVENETAVESLSTAFASTSLATFGAELNAKGLSNTELFTLQGNAYTAANLLTYVLEEEITPKGPAGFFASWYAKFVAQALAKTEEKDLENNNKDYQALLKEYRDGILLFSLTNQEVWQKGINDSLGQVQYYTQNLKDYQWKNRIEGYLVKVNDATKLEGAQKALQNKTYDSATFAAFEASLANTSPEAYSIESGTFEYEVHPLLSKVDRSKTYQELLHEGNTYLIVLGKALPAGPKKFEEVRGPVIRDYQAQLEKTLNERLKAKFPVQINTDVKEKVFAALNH